MLVILGHLPITFIEGLNSKMGSKGKNSIQWLLLIDSPNKVDFQDTLYQFICTPGKT